MGEEGCFVGEELSDWKQCFEFVVDVEDIVLAGQDALEFVGRFDVGVHAGNSIVVVLFYLKGETNNFMPRTYVFSSFSIIRSVSDINVDFYFIVWVS